MTWFGRKSLTYLGSLHGKGTLLVDDGRQLGHVMYEIDGYLEHDIKSANGQIEAETCILDEAFRTDDATILLDCGRCIQVVVSDPHGGTTAELNVRSGFPL